MDLKLHQSLVGLRLLAASAHRSNYKILSCSKYKDENELPVIGRTLDDSNGKKLKNLLCAKQKSILREIRKKPSDVLSSPTKNVQTETLASSSSTILDNVEDSGFREQKRGCAETEEATKKKPRFERSTREGQKSSSALLLPPSSANCQSETRATGCSTNFGADEDSGFCVKRKKEKEIEEREVTKKKATLDRSIDDQPQRLETFSSNSTYFSGAEENIDDTLLIELETKNATARQNSVELPKRSSRISTHNYEALRYIRLLLEVLEGDSLVYEIAVRSRWEGTIAKEAVDVFVRLADDACLEDTAQLCRTEAVTSLGIVYERALTYLNSIVLNKETVWNIHFSIFLRLCDSKSICKEFVKFFTAQMMIPQSSEDLEDPNQIIEGVIELNQARFGLIQQRNVLRKYAKQVKESDNETNVCSQRCSATLRKCYLPWVDEFDFQLLNKLEDYAGKISNNFEDLCRLTARNLTLLKSRMSRRFNTLKI